MTTTNASDDGRALPDSDGIWIRNGAVWNITIRPDGSGSAILPTEEGQFVAFANRDGMAQSLPTGNWQPAKGEA
jgi:hypothetical protein